VRCKFREWIIFFIEKFKIWLKEITNLVIDEKLIFFRVGAKSKRIVCFLIKQIYDDSEKLAIFKICTGYFCHGMFHPSLHY